MYEAGMSARAPVICRTLWQQGARQLARWWIEPRPLPRAAMRGFELPLLPSPLARRARWCFLVLQLAFACELAWIGHWPASWLVLLATLGWSWVSRGPRNPHRRQLRRLLLSADGRLHGLAANGEVLDLRLHPSSLSLGRWLLLRVTGAGHRHVLLLGPDNVAPAALAELRRRLAFSAGDDFD